MPEITQQWVNDQEWQPAKPHLLTLADSFNIIDQTQNQTCLIWFNTDGSYAGYSRIKFRTASPIVGNRIAIVMIDERPPTVHLIEQENQVFVWPNACFPEKGDFPCLAASSTTG